MAANFSDPEKHEELDLKIAEPVEAPLNEPGLSRRQIEYREKYKEDYVSLRHRFPGGMNDYERNWMYQFGMYLVIMGIFIGNIVLNFRMIDIYQDLLDDLRALPDVDELDAGNLDTLLEQFNNESVNDDTLCDINYFVNDFDKQELEDSVLRAQRVVKAAAYIALGFTFWLTGIIKAMSGYNLCTEDFNVTRTATLEKRRKESVENPELARQREEERQEHIGNVIRVAGGVLRNQETAGEKKIRTYLRSETVLFGQNQVLQDIPIATASVLYFLFLLRERGVLCYQSVTENRLATSFSIDNADPLVFLQLAVILLNVFVNIVVNLAPRWIAFFNHQTVKHSLRPKSTTIRIFNLAAAVVAYMIAIFLPLLIIMYSPFGNDLLGLNTTNSLFILVLIVFSSISLAVGTFLICCHWGGTLSEGLCFCGVILAAFETGCEGCFEIEICELCECCC